MKKNQRSVDSSSDQHVSEFDELVSEYDQRWHSVAVPRIEEYLDRAPIQERSRLFGKLLRIKVDHLSRYHCVPSREEYIAVFPKERDAINEALSATHQKTITLQASDQQEIDMTIAGALDCHLDRQDNPTSRLTSYESRFKIVQEHAKGGLGRVMIANDLELDRQVALKEIQDRFAEDPSSRRRFFSEARVTGQLEHPGIVPVYGLGMYPNGRPYYAMRFIHGESLKEAIDRFDYDRSSIDFSAMSFRRLLRSLIDTCNAVHYAHSRGVLHRDIKPANIMLGDFGETLLVDWGLAKRLTSDSAAESEAFERGQMADDLLQTGTGSPIGTPAYMSPEQSTGRHEELSPKSDIYSLGATLYQLLTGKVSVSGNGLNELVERVSTGDFVSARERNSAVPKALNAICCKAMSLRIEDRYESSAEMAEDIERWLADERIEAYEEPLHQAARRWMRKHPKTIGSLAASLLVGLMSAIALSAIVLDHNQILGHKNEELRQANRLESEARSKAEKLAGQLSQANLEIAQERDVAFAISEFVQKDILALTMPEREPDRDIKLRTVLDRAAVTVQNRFVDKPIVEAAISLTIGASYRALGDHARAESLIVRARDLRQDHLGASHADTITSNAEVALLLSEQGDVTDSESLFYDILELSRREFGDDHILTLSIANNLATALLDHFNYADAETLLTETLPRSESALGEHHIVTLSCVNGLARLYSSTSRLDDAENLFGSLIDAYRGVYGADHPYTLTALHNAAALNLEQGDYQEAEAILVAVLESSERIYGDGHPSTANSIALLAASYEAQGRFEQARALLEESFELSKQKLGEDHTQTLVGMTNLAALYTRKSEFEKAEPIVERAIELQTRILGADNPLTLQSESVFALIQKGLGRLELASQINESVLETRKRVLGPFHDRTLESMNNLAQVYKEQGRLDDAESLVEEASTILQSKFGEEHPHTLVAKNNLADVFRLQGRYLDAELLFEQLIEQGERILGVEHPYTLRFKYSQADLYTSMLEEKIASHGWDSSETWPAMRRLAIAHLEFGSYEYAESLLIGVIRRTVADNPTASTAIDDMTLLIDLYVSWGKSDEADKWRQRQNELRQHIETTPSTRH